MSGADVVDALCHCMCRECPKRRMCDDYAGQADDDSQLITCIYAVEESGFGKHYPQRINAESENVVCPECGQWINEEEFEPTHSGLIGNFEKVGDTGIVECPSCHELFDVIVDKDKYYSVTPFGDNEAVEYASAWAHARGEEFRPCSHGLYARVHPEYVSAFVCDSLECYSCEKRSGLICTEHWPAYILNNRIQRPAWDYGAVVVHVDPYVLATALLAGHNDESIQDPYDGIFDYPEDYPCPQK